jgi:hypothetical protein
MSQMHLVYFPVRGCRKIILLSGAGSFYKVGPTPNFRTNLPEHRNAIKIDG